MRSLDLSNKLICGILTCLLAIPSVHAYGQSDQKPAEPKPAPPAKSPQEADPSSEQPAKLKAPKQEAPQTEKKESSSTRRTRSRLDSTKKAAGFVDLFAPITASMDASTVKIMLDKEQLALGTVIDPEGLVLTKASEIRDGMTITVNNKKLTPNVIGIHPESDLALLRIDAKSLNTIQWSQEPTPSLGHWVASPKAEKRGDSPAIGIIATEKVRVIPPSRTFIGINMSPVEKDGGVKIVNIVDNSPAKRAGLEVGDVLVKLDNEEIKSIENLHLMLKQYDAGDRVEITLLRKDIERKIKLTLAERDKVSPARERSNQQNSMGSVLSKRRKDFPMAFQHDSMLNSNTCGGPIVDLSGKAIGINIARSGRVSSLALPVSTVLPIIEMLKSGELSPAIVNKAKIESLQVELVELKKLNRTLNKRKGVYSVRYNLAKGRRQEIEKAIDKEKSRIEALEQLLAESKKQLEESEKRMETIEGEAAKYKTDYDKIRDQLRGNDSIISELEDNLQQLKTGSGR